MEHADYKKLLAKSPESGGTTLRKHLCEVAEAAVLIARNRGMNEDIARLGGLLHDIGKASPYFQRTLKSGYVPRPGFVWRHEIASLFFISLATEEWQPQIIEMIAAHHKSIKDDVGEKGLLDLEDYTDDSFEIHAKDFDKWSPVAIDLLKSLGVETHPVSTDEARQNYDSAVNYCRKLGNNCSLWKGVLMAADHLVSAIDPDYRQIASHLFIHPDLSFYERRHELYPLSLLSADDARKHTLVTAPTGAGKTDFLLRRCRGQVFYTLPFQASINAMYDRIKNDLQDTDAYVTLLHATSDLKVEDGKLEERIMQHHVGASVKVLTPHQMASVVFGIKGYEAMSVDLRGCDVILDEIHTYSDKMQAIVCRMIEILVALGCRIHVGTATMPTVLYNRILNLLGGPEQVYEVKLPDEILRTFNRHIIHKCTSQENVAELITESVANGRKLLIVCNQVSRAQQWYQYVIENYADIDSMLIHSRFKRGRRGELECELKEHFDKSSEACIVVSTQVVEVSLDISFDVMITECAPIDALIQRFGRINRKRNREAIGYYKPIYVVAPPEDKKEALPYNVDVLQKSFEVLPDGKVLEETELQSLIDQVYPDDTFINIDYAGAVFVNGQWQLKELRHNAKSALLDVMEFSSAVCICESDEERYLTSGRMASIQMEIPVSYRSIAYSGFKQLEKKNRPFVIPDACYDDNKGLQPALLKEKTCKTFEIL